MTPNRPMMWLAPVVLLGGLLLAPWASAVPTDNADRANGITVLGDSGAKKSGGSTNVAGAASTGDVAKAAAAKTDDEAKPEEKKEKNRACEANDEESRKAMSEQKADCQQQANENTERRRNGEKVKELSQTCKELLKCVALTTIDTGTGEGTDATRAAENTTATGTPAATEPETPAVQAEAQTGRATRFGGCTDTECAQPAVQTAAENGNGGSVADYSNATPQDRELGTTGANAAQNTAASGQETLQQAAYTGDAQADARATLGDTSNVGANQALCMQGVLNNCRATGAFGTDRGDHVHAGVDMGATTAGVAGDPVYSSINGVVTRNGYDADGYGHWVEISNGSTSIRLAHLQAPSSLVLGEQVNAGDYVGGMGNTGGSRGVHLHYEVRIGGQAINPASTQALNAVVNARGGVTAIAHSSAVPSGINLAGNNTLNGGYATAAAYTGGISIGGYTYPVQVASPLGMLIQAALTSTGTGAVQWNTAGNTMGQGVQVGGGQQTALPVILLTSAQADEVQRTGTLPTTLTDSQNSQFPTDCTNQASTAANDDLLRPACRGAIADTV